MPEKKKLFQSDAEIDAFVEDVIKPKENLFKSDAEIDSFIADVLPKQTVQSAQPTTPVDMAVSADGDDTVVDNFNVDSILNTVSAPAESTKTPIKSELDPPEPELSPGVFEQLKEATARGQEGFDLDIEAFEAATGSRSWKDVDLKRRALKERPELPLRKSNLLGRAAIGAAETLPGMIEGYKQGLPMGLSAAGSAFVAGQAGPQVATPEEIVTMPTAFGVGMATGSAMEFYKQGTGQFYGALRDDGVDHNVSSIVSQIAGAPYSLIEVSQLSRLIPGFKNQLLKAATGTAKEISGKLIKEFGVNWAENVTEEVLQEIVGIAAEEIGKKIDKKGSETTTGKLLSRLANTAIESALSLGLIQLPGASLKAAISLSNATPGGIENEAIRDPEKDAEKISNLADKIVNGERNFTDEDLQIEENYPRELESELEKRFESSKNISKKGRDVTDKEAIFQEAARKTDDKLAPEPKSSLNAEKLKEQLGRGESSIPKQKVSIADKNKLAKNIELRIKKSASLEDLQALNAELNKSDLGANHTNRLASRINERHKQIEKLDAQKKTPIKDFTKKKSKKVEFTDDPLENLIRSGIRLTESDYYKGKMRGETKDLRRKLGPRAFVKEGGRTLDEYATDMGITEDELRQKLLHEYKTKKQKKAEEASLKEAMDYFDDMGKKLAQENKNKSKSEKSDEGVVKKESLEKTRKVTSVTPKVAKVTKDTENQKTEKAVDKKSVVAKQPENQPEPAPSEAQKEAGNYKKGHVSIAGLDISIENAKGQFREGVDKSGKKWRQEMKYDYGYLRGTVASDKDHIDVFINHDKPGGATKSVFVVDQIDQKTGKFDEPKVMIGFSSKDAAVEAYRSNYEKGWKVGKVTEFSQNEFKDWAFNPVTSKKPAAEFMKSKQWSTDKEKLKKFAGTEKASIDFIDEISDKQTLLEMAGSSSLKNGNYIVGNRVYSVSGKSVKPVQGIYVHTNWGKDPLFTFTKTPEIPKNIEDIPIFHGTNENIKNAKELKPGGDFSKHSAPNEFRAIYFSQRPQGISLTENWGDNIIEARLKSDTNIVSFKEAMKIRKNHPNMDQTKALLESGIDAVGTKNDFGVYEEIAVLNKDKILNAPSETQFEKPIKKGERPQGKIDLGVQREIPKGKTQTQQFVPKEGSLFETKPDGEQGGLFGKEEMKTDGLGKLEKLARDFKKTNPDKGYKDFNTLVFKGKWRDKNPFTKGKVSFDTAALGRELKEYGYRNLPEWWRDKIEGKKEPSTQDPSMSNTKKPTKSDSVNQKIAKKKAAKLRESAERLTKRIDELKNPAISNQNATARRARIAGDMAERGRRLEKVQTIMLKLADMHESGNISEDLAKVSSAADVEYIMNHRKAFLKIFANNEIAAVIKNKGGYSDVIESLGAAAKAYNMWISPDAVNLSRYREALNKSSDFYQPAGKSYKTNARYSKSRAIDSLRDFVRVAKFGIKTESDYNNFRDKLLKLGEKEISAEEKQANEVRKIETDLIGNKIPGFFPTPKRIVNDMVERAGIEKGDKVLEPSAGKGDIAEAIKENGVNPDVIEINHTLRKLLKTKGFSLVGDDFLDHSEKYDKIIMNPPFEKLQDIDHVKHAYELLKPGGTVVSIMSESPFFRKDAKAAEFREWLESVGGISEKLDEGSFKGAESFRQTGVNGRIVEISKPSETTQDKKLTRSDVVKRIEAIGLPKKQTDAYIKLLDVRAKEWSKETGKPAEQWFERIADVKKSTQKKFLAERNTDNEGNPAASTQKNIAREPQSVYIKAKEKLDSYAVKEPKTLQSELFGAIDYQSLRKTKSQRVTLEASAGELRKAEGERNALDTEKPVLKDQGYSALSRKFTKDKYFSFTSRSNKINNYSDVAFIFRSLEREDVEHAFAVHVLQDGSYYVQHIGMGNINSAIIDPSEILGMAKSVKAKEVYFVHNHPSGNLTASHEDYKVYNSLGKILTKHSIVLNSGTIINLNSGKFSKFDHTTIEMNAPKSIVETPVDIYTFSRKVFFEGFNQGKVDGQDAVAKYLSNFRHGVGDKIGALILATNNNIIGNFPLTKLGWESAALEADVLASKMGGANIILYGNRPIAAVPLKLLDRSLFNTSRGILDYIHIDTQNATSKEIYKSFAEGGRIVSEKKGRYGKVSAQYFKKNPNILFQDNQNAPTFYSNLRNTIEQKMPNKADAATVRGIVKNVKQEELQWSGIDDYLNENRKVEKAELLSYLRANAVKLEETVKKDKIQIPPKDVATALKIISKYEESFADDLQMMIDEDEYAGFNDGLRAFTETGHLTDAESKTLIGIAERNNLASSKKPKFGDYVLPGGDNYKETLLRLPVAMEETPYYEAVYPNGAVEGEYTNREAAEDIARIINGKVQERTHAKRGQDVFVNEAHFNEPNILAHIRHNDRTAANGDKVLFLEEIQSDWHQTGRQKGYKKQLTQKEENRLNELVEKSVDFATEMTDTETAEMYRLQSIEKGAVPDAPFKKTWHELAFRRMVREAAEKGYDRIAWTTGEQQAERYDLSKQVDSVEWTPWPASGEDMGILVARKDGSQVLRETIPESKLEDYIGKEAAKKLLEQKPDIGGRRSLEGENLKVGGKGMKGFYDSTLVNYAKKFGKKFGARVEDVAISVAKSQKSREDFLYDKEAMEKFEQNIPVFFYDRYGEIDDATQVDTKEELKDALDRGDFVFVKTTDSKATVHSLPITPEMRRTAMQQGFPLFQKSKGAVEFLDDNRAIIHAFEGADISTLAHETAHIFLEDLYDSGNTELIAKFEKWADLKVGLREASEGEYRRAHEKFARGFERYLAEGDAPNAELKTVFEKFKKWLTDIYKAIKGSDIDVNINGDIKSVFEGLLGGKDVVKIEQKSANRSPEPAIGYGGNRAGKGKIAGIEEYSPIEKSDFTESDLNDPVRLRNIGKKLSTDLEMIVGQRVRMGLIKRFIGRALGVYFPDSGIVRVRNINDIPVLAHELGHKLDIEIFGSSNKIMFEGGVEAQMVVMSAGRRDPRMREKLLDTYRKKYGKAFVDSVLERYELRKELTGFVKSYNYPLERYKDSDAKAKELIAEFIKAYVTHPKSARTQAPKFSKVFDNLMAQNPDIKRALDSAKETYASAKIQDPRILTEATIQRNTEEDGMLGAIKKIGKDFYINAIDGLDAFRKLQHELHKINPNTRGAKDPLLQIISVLGVDGKADQYLYHQPFQKIGDDISFNKSVKPLMRIIEPILKSGRIKSYEGYLTALRNIELYDTGRGAAATTTKKVAEETKMLYEKELGTETMRGFAKDVYAYNNELLEYYRSSGKIDTDIYNDIKELNKYYVPFKRFFDEYEATGQAPNLSKYVKDTSPSPVKTIRGSQREIVSPIGSMIKNTYDILTASDRNDALRTLVNSLNQIDKTLVQEIPAKVFRKVKVFEPGIEVDPISGMISFGESKLVDRFAIEYKKPENQQIVTVWNHGQQVYYQIPKEYYDAFFAINEPVAKAVRLLSLPSRLLQAGAVQFDPTFAVRNVPRDQMSALFYSNYNYNPFHFFSGLLSYIKKDDIFQKFLASGGDQSFLTAMDQQLSKSYIDKKAGKNVSTRMKNYARNPLKVFQDINKLSELGTRIGAFKNAFIKTGDVYRSMQEGRDIGADYSVKGMAMRNISPLYPFLNARIQHLRMTTNAFKKHPGRSIFKGMAFVTIPALINWFMNNWDEEDRKLYRELPSWRRIGFFNIRIPGTNSFFPIPKGFFGTLFGSTAEYAMDYLKDNSPESIPDLLKALFHEVSPVNNPVEGIPQFVRPIVEQWANKKSFTGRPIVSQRYEYLPSQYQYNEYTSQTIVKIGQAIGVSPMRLQEFIRGYGAGFSNYPIAFSDELLQVAGIVKEDSDDRFKVWGVNFSRMPIIRGFTPETPTGNRSRSVERFYNKLDKLEEINKSANLFIKSNDYDSLNDYLSDKEDDYRYYLTNQTQINKFKEVMRASFYLRLKLSKPERDKLDASITQTAFEFAQSYENKTKFSLDSTLEKTLKGYRLEKRKSKKGKVELTRSLGVPQKPKTRKYVRP